VLPLPPVALLWIIVLAFGHNPTWLLIVMGVATALGLESVVSLSWRIRRESARGINSSPDPN
jgi:hypothetical protein